MKSYIHLIVLNDSSSWPGQIDLARKEFWTRKSDESRIGIKREHNIHGKWSLTLTMTLVRIEIL